MLKSRDTNGFENRRPGHQRQKGIEMEENLDMTPDTGEEEVLEEGFDLFGDGDTNDPREDRQNQDEIQADGTAGQEQAESDGREGPDGSGQAKEPEKRMLKLRFNGQDIEKSEEEVLQLAQKGMNYDHVKSRLDEAQKAMPAADLLSRFAQEAGVSLEEYITQAHGQLSAKALRELTDKGMPENEARELLELRQEKSRQDRMRQERQADEASRKQWLEYVEAYPEIAAKGKLDPDVARRISAGMSPVQAQLAHDNEQLRLQLDALKAGEKNKKTAPGSAAADGDKGQSDPFLSGLAYE